MRVKLTKVGSVGFGFEGPWRCVWCESEWTLTSLDRCTTFHFDELEGDYHAMKCPVCHKEANRIVPEGARKVFHDDV